SSFGEYATKYKSARMERRNGVLQVTLHTDGQSLRWGFLPHGELPEAFHDIGADRENRVVILTGTGHEFSGPRATPGTSSFPARYFLVTGQTRDAADALRLGLVAEVLPADKLLARAWELAEDLVRKPTLLLRYTRLLFTEYLRRQMHDLLGYGLAMESLALFE